MKIIKHLIKVIRAKSRMLFCKHAESYDASCPFTGKTYTTCTQCLKRISVKDTVNDQV